MRRVAVITGASSGIGEATALALAQAGVDVVLAARRIALLEEVAERCRAFGVHALPVETDVSQPDEVDFLSQTAIDEFGSYDIWINNAAVTLVGQFTDMSPEMFRKVVDTNFYGYVYGAWAAMGQFQAQGHGTLINISSVFGVVPTPYETPYVASKFAIRGFSAALRQEIELLDLPNVHVCTVLPSAIDTPIYRNAANVSGQGIKPPAPIYPVEEVVNSIIGLLDEPRPEIYVGRAGHSIAFLRGVLPAGLFERLFGKYIEMTHFTHEKTPAMPGNVFEPGGYEGISGRWPKEHMAKKVLYASAGVALGLGLLYWRLHGKKRHGSKA